MSDLDRAIAFYAAVLGQAVTREGGPGFAFGLLPHEGQDVGGSASTCRATTTRPRDWGR